MDRSIRLRKEATLLLKRTAVMETLSRHGTPHLIGSYALDLMHDKDIDIVVEAEDPRQSSLAVLQEFLQQRKFQKYEYGDFVKFKRVKRPQGFIVNLRRDGWEIEIWFLRSVEKELMLNETLKRLTPAQRKRILSLKAKRANDGFSKHELSSIAIYEKVLGKRLV